MFVYVANVFLMMFVSACAFHVWSFRFLRLDMWQE